jgi:hypothetical protein
MNPWAFILFIIAIVIGIAAAKGKQDDLVAAITGKKYGDSNLQ